MKRLFRRTQPEKAGQRADKQEKALIILCVVVAFIMLLSLARRFM